MAAGARVGFLVALRDGANFAQKCYPGRWITNHRSSRTPHAIPELFHEINYDEKIFARELITHF